MPSYASKAAYAIKSRIPAGVHVAESKISVFAAAHASDA